MRNLSPASVSELLQGKKTYIAAAIGLAYMVGVWLKLWDYDERVLAVLGMSGLAFLRAAVQKGPTFLLCKARYHVPYPTSACVAIRGSSESSSEGPTVTC